METLLYLRVVARKVIYFFSLRNFDTNRLPLLWKAEWYPANEIDVSNQMWFFLFVPISVILPRDIGTV